MSHSNWADWLRPDIGRAGLGTGVQEDREGQFGDTPDQVDALRAIIAAERGRPVLMPLFPVGFFTPGSPCPHRRDIRWGSTFCCMVCHQSGMDDHPHLKETAAGAIALKCWRPTDEQGRPTQDPWSVHDTAEPTAYRAPEPGQPATRRQRRDRRFRPQVEPLE